MRTVRAMNRFQNLSLLISGVDLYATVDMSDVRSTALVYNSLGLTWHEILS